MPLPAALQARLLRRGLVVKEVPPPAPQPAVAKTAAGEDVEEVFAEDYDEPNKNEPQMPEATMVTIEVQDQVTPVDDNSPLINQVPACPNRSNQYHTCAEFCKEKWGMKEWQPGSDMIRKRDRMLRKYPLPDEWLEVADTETNRYFYWNTTTDQVSWLSPLHPTAQITLSSETLRKIAAEAESISQPKVSQSDSEDEEEDMDVNGEGSDLSESSLSSSDEDEYEKHPPPRRQDKEDRDGRDRSRGRYGGRGGSRKRDESDPMDPSSYSDVARGGWSSGLERRGEAKTGVDTTASGPLFQQRPYPSPGAILRANKTPKPS